MAEGRERIIVIGLDGATFDVIDPLVAEGRMPHMAALLEDGVRGVLRSTIPPNTAVAWTSFRTGTNPGKHGVYHMMGVVGQGYTERFWNNRAIHGVPFELILSRNGRQVIVYDVPGTYPPDREGPLVVASAFIPSSTCDFTHPSTLHTELIREVGDYPLESSVLQAYRRGDSIAATKALFQFMEVRRRVCLYLMRRYPWDVMMVVFRATDVVQHAVGRLLASDGGQVPRYKRLVEQCYQRTDSLLGEILEEIDSSTTVIIMSDHGAGPGRKNFYLNQWLQKQGLLKFTRGFSIKRHIPQSLGGVKGMRGRANLRKAPHWVDWTRTRAWSGWRNQPSIWINLKGRQPQGIVERGEDYEELRTMLIAELPRVIDPDTGSPVIDRVYRREELYWGPFLEEAPDLISIPRDWSYCTLGRIDIPCLLEHPPKGIAGQHRMDGILVMQGPHIRRNVVIEGAEIIDVAPTVLHLSGCPVTDDMDGKVLAETMDPSWLASHPVRREAIGESGTREELKVYTDREQEQMEDGLRALGYVD
jgi:predicted AlkP superfamily phosphohydrolase/phosphomutase